MSGQHQANAKCRNSVAAIYNNYTTKTCRIVYIRVHFFRMDCICFVYRICVQFRSVWASPQPGLAPAWQSRTFFSHLKKRLNFNLPFFYIVRISRLEAAFRQKSPVFFSFHPILTSVFTNRSFPDSETLGT